MRPIVVGAVAGAASLIAAPGAAQTAAPWCLKTDVGAGAMVDRCYYRTYEQCAQERFVWGTTSYCIVNPDHYFAAKAGERVPGKPRRRSNR
jgi:hypothetical protein